MPLVRIDIKKNADITYAPKVAEAVYEALKDALNVAINDNFHIINEHDNNHLIYDRGYLGIKRSDDFLAIQISLIEGRTVEQKKLLYKTIVEKLQQKVSIRAEDVLIGLVEVKKENWSFGNGLAQYAD